MCEKRNISVTKCDPEINNDVRCGNSMGISAESPNQVRNQQRKGNDTPVKRLDMVGWSWMMCDIMR